MQETFPDKKIFVLAGFAHFTDDPVLTNALNERNCIIIMPLRKKAEEIPSKEYKKLVEESMQYYDESVLVAYLRMRALSNL